MTRAQTAPIRGPRILGDEELFALAARAVSYSLDITRDEIEAMAAALLDREHDRAALQAEREAHHACALELDAAHTEVSRLRALLLDRSMRTAVPTITGRSYDEVAEDIDDDTVVVDVDSAPIDCEDRT